MSSRFIWHELFSTNIQASMSFYGEIFGYTFEEDTSNTIIFSNEDGPQGAITPITRDMGLPSTWLGFVTVKSAERTIRKIESLGGTLVIPFQDIPGQPKVIMFTGPEGAALKAIEGDGRNREQSYKQGARGSDDSDKHVAISPNGSRKQIARCSNRSRKQCARGSNTSDKQTGRNSNASDV